MATPSTAIWPRLAGMRPATSCSNVVLPQPDGPIMQTNSWARITRLTSDTASTSAPPDRRKNCRTLRSWTSAIARLLPQRRAVRLHLVMKPNIPPMAISKATATTASAMIADNTICVSMSAAIA